MQIKLTCIAGPVFYPTQGYQAYTKNDIWSFICGYGTTEEEAVKDWRRKIEYVTKFIWKSNLKRNDEFVPA